MDSSIPFLTLFLTTLCFLPTLSNAGLLSEPVEPTEPANYSTPNTVPAFPVQTESQTCQLELSNELFGGVNEACGHNLDRSRCCPVLAAWLYAAHARTALKIHPAQSPAQSPAVSPESDSELPMMPDSNSQKCANSLMDSLEKRKIKLAQPNSTCDTVLCFCGIRLHEIASLSCPLAFNVTDGHRNATPTAAVKNLEKNCRNSSYAGCTKCLGALEKLKGGDKNGTKTKQEGRASKMFKRDCQLMGLTWLLAHNKTKYIPTVSAVLRALMYSAHPPHQTNPKCSPDQENMPLAVDSLQFYKNSSSPPSIFIPHFLLITSLIIFWLHQL